MYRGRQPYTRPAGQRRAGPQRIGGRGVRVAQPRVDEEVAVHRPAQMHLGRVAAGGWWAQRAVWSIHPSTHPSVRPSVPFTHPPIHASVHLPARVRAPCMCMYIAGAPRACM